MDNVSFDINEVFKYYMSDLVVILIFEVDSVLVDCENDFEFFLDNVIINGVLNFIVDVVVENLDVIIRSSIFDLLQFLLKCVFIFFVFFLFVFNNFFFFLMMVGMFFFKEFCLLDFGVLVCCMKEFVFELFKLFRYIFYFFVYVLSKIFDLIIFGMVIEVDVIYYDFEFDEQEFIVYYKMFFEMYGFFFQWMIVVVEIKVVEKFFINMLVC